MVLCDLVSSLALSGKVVKCVFKIKIFIFEKDWFKINIRELGHNNEYVQEAYGVVV